MLPLCVNSLCCSSSLPPWLPCFPISQYKILSNALSIIFPEGTTMLKFIACTVIRATWRNFQLGFFYQKWILKAVNTSLNAFLGILGIQFSLFTF